MINSLSCRAVFSFLVLVIGDALIVPTAGADDFSVSLSVNKAVMAVDDGVARTNYFVDDITYPSQFSLTGNRDVESGIKAGGKMTIGVASNTSDTVSNNNNGSKSSGDQFQMQYMDAWLTGSFGKVSIGRGESATSYFTEWDLAGDTWIMMQSGANDWGGSMQFRNSWDHTFTDAVGNASPTLWDSIDPQEVYRSDRVRYDSPSIGPVGVSVAAGTNDKYNFHDIGFSGGNDFSDGSKFMARAGYHVTDTGGQPNSVGAKKDILGSVAYLWPNGVSVLYGFTRLNTDGDPASGIQGKTSDYDYVKLAYAIGRSTAVIDTARARDESQVGDRGKELGVGYMYTPVKWLNLYSAFKVFRLDRPGSQFNDIKVFFVGMRVEFSKTGGIDENH